MCECGPKGDSERLGLCHGCDDKERRGSGRGDKGGGVSGQAGGWVGDWAGKNLGGWAGGRMGGWTGEHVGWWAGNLKAGGQARCHFCLSNGNDRPLTAAIGRQTVEIPTVQPSKRP